MSCSEVQGVPSVPQLDWYALYTRHQHEKAIALSLSKKGYEVFLPLYNAAHRWKDRTKQLSLPLFPCYVFLRAGGHRWLPVLTTPGVHMVVSYAGQPATIPPTEIEAIRRAMEGSKRVEPYPFLKTGDWARVHSGSLAGIEGILVRKKNDFRLVLSVEMLGKSAAVEVDIATIERIARRTPTRLVASPGGDLFARSRP